MIMPLSEKIKMFFNQLHCLLFGHEWLERVDHTALYCPRCGKMKYL